jgi:hypothetical protein
MAHSENKIDTINFLGTSYDVHDAQAVHLDDDTETVSCTTISSNSNSFRILMTQTSGTSGNPTTLSTYVNDNIYITPSAGKITATCYHAKSDLRLKENIKDYIPKNSILDLPVVEFDFKNSAKHQIGCIAQDLQNLFPELVDANDEGYLTIAENKLVYLCIIEIKKLKAEIEALKTNKE